MNQPKGTVASIANWFETAKPEETRTIRDIQVQVGVHFEEVHEMLEEISGLNEETEYLLSKAKTAMAMLATHFKTDPNVIFVIDEPRHQNFLDSLCDQVVTAIGVGQYMLYKIVPAITEVDSSNWSKFIDDEHGTPRCVKDANGKIAKGPKYFKADLFKYII